MDTAAISQTVAATATTKEAQSSAALSSDLDTFLKLLTAQIENQDPLEPADGTEYAAQLAQFSSVEQAVRTNELLAEMSGNLARQDMAMASGWIGMDVRHTGPLALQGDPVQLYFNIPSAADRAEMVVTNQAGEEVLRRPINPDSTTLDWSGGDGQGRTIADGIYTVKVAAFGGDAELGVHDVTHYARVKEVTLGDGSADIILAGGVRLSTNDVEGLRDAG